jgi:hypothetical protein
MDLIPQCTRPSRGKVVWPTVAFRPKAKAEIGDSPPPISRRCPTGEIQPAGRAGTGV